MRFRDRQHAGQVLAERMTQYAGRENVIVLALPRGGVPVGFEVARSLGVPLDVFVVRKLGLPGHKELAMGAIATGGVTVVNEDVVRSFGISDATLRAAADREVIELRRRESLYRGDAPPLELEGWVAILVDDGLATGSTMRAAIAALRHLGPKEVVVAVPTAAPETCAEVGRLVDAIVCASTPEPFYAVGLWYENFVQTTDDEVRELLSLARG
jgi:putative phosphoribosyl transferase